MLNFRYLQRSFSRNVLDREDAIDLHTGFYLAAEEVYQAILPHLNRNYQTRLTGHSLGGAIAVILMMFLLVVLQKTVEYIAKSSHVHSEAASPDLCVAVVRVRL